jgi:UDP-3-O-[3-hydroxymyristoyl] glucosamine N-acyltransferase
MRSTNALLPHRAGVVLGDDVFLGPHVNVAAGLIEPTTIGSGSRLDAHIQVGHNVRIGSRCILAGQSGMAGSSELGDDCLVGGQAAISDHVRLGRRCVIAAKAGVTKSFGDDFFLQGFPARPGRRM